MAFLWKKIIFVSRLMVTSLQCLHAVIIQYYLHTEKSLNYDIMSTKSVYVQWYIISRYRPMLQWHIKCWSALIIMLSIYMPPKRFISETTKTKQVIRKEKKKTTRNSELSARWFWIYKNTTRKLRVRMGCY